MSTDGKLEDRIDELERQVAALQRQLPRRTGKRKRSELRLFGVPLYDIALGPDEEKGERRGHARGILAIGDVATGVVALGGVAHGLIAIGGVAIGGIAFGGVALGVLLAAGGAAIGTVAMGGAAVGYYACGGSAVGEFVLSAARRDPEAIRFFTQWFPVLEMLRFPRGR